MICDTLATLCDGTALNTGAAGSYIIGDQIDLRLANHGIGKVDGLYLVITVDTTATSGGSATGTFSLVTDTDSTLGSPVVLASSKAWPVASMTQGQRLLAIELPVSEDYERYIGIQQTTGVAAFTAGKINAFLTNTPPVRRAYPDGI